MTVGVLVDEEDSDLKVLPWNVRGSLEHPYHGRTIGEHHNVSEYLHVVVLERAIGRPLLPAETGDHINGNTLDNRRTNLRACSHVQNMQNQRTPKRRCRTSRFKGVSVRPDSGRWTARITVDRKTVRLGTFKDEGLAARAYDAAARRLFGSFARLNFPCHQEQPA